MTGLIRDQLVILFCEMPISPFYSHFTRSAENGHARLKCVISRNQEKCFCHIISTTRCCYKKYILCEKYNHIGAARYQETCDM